ncbi:nicotinate-nucleotide adenylyltransferase [Pseudoponticoccus marisrubri]|uniref:Probable nicotinate-nucleotide adenylyltransferase n=1 Tax=Pseudoponticoccus marisrubri TaxID=1685382 RepID=A0A0W7WQB8_9RHOB|nr:nicotinate-nucleotide adenylyltransferase [Pseudoponticoccus marisrubri]KUF12799.1 nicotinate-nicotinamide nucleotide adenylyltransferase [Pseudoponticoccus marisrubri]
MFLRAGQRVGLLGGSFDPPHAGHLHLSREALKRFDLDRVVWLVSPGNPLKPNPPAALARRMDAARALVSHPRILISDFEAQAGTRFTAETLAALQARHRGVRFVWLMGADNLAQLHRWDRWHEIMHRVPMGVMARPGLRIAARASVASRVYAGARLPAAQSGRLALCAPPAWCFVNIPMIDLSSTELRARGGWS